MYQKKKKKINTNNVTHTSMNRIETNKSMKRSDVATVKYFACIFSYLYIRIHLFVCNTLHGLRCEKNEKDDKLVRKLPYLYSKQRFENTRSRKGKVVCRG